LIGFTLFGYFSGVRYSFSSFLYSHRLHCVVATTTTLRIRQCRSLLRSIRAAMIGAFGDMGATTKKRSQKHVHVDIHTHAQTREERDVDDDDDDDGVDGVYGARDGGGIRRGATNRLSDRGGGGAGGTGVRARGGNNDDGMMLPASGTLTAQRSTEGDVSSDAVAATGSLAAGRGSSTSRASRGPGRDEAAAETADTAIYEVRYLS
jgi:hypothetical protein